MSYFEQRVRAMIRVGKGNEWLRYGKMAIYLRVGPRLIGDRMHLCIQLANLATPPEYQRKGLFTEMLACVKRLTDLPIYVEQILNRDFLEALLRRGFSPARDYDGMTWDVVLLGGSLETAPFGPSKDQGCCI